MIEKHMRSVLKRCQNPMRIKFDRIETGSNTIGVPDTHFYSEKYRIFGWMELKHVPSMYGKASIKIPWQGGQLLKGAQYCKAGENVWLCLSIDDSDYFWFIPCDLWKDSYITSYLFKEPLISSYHKKELNEKLLRSILV